MMPDLVNWRAQNGLAIEYWCLKTYSNDQILVGDVNRHSVSTLNNAGHGGNMKVIAKFGNWNDVEVEFNPFANEEY